MPELPEVETVRRGLQRELPGRRVEEVIVRRRTLRRPLPAKFAQRLAGSCIRAVARRGKYLLLDAPPQTCIIHLGMSGALSLSHMPPHNKHDHIALLLDDARYLTYNDPRRFGLVTLTDAPPAQHPLLAAMGVEPLTRAFGGAQLARLLRGKNAPIKTALMQAHLIAGIGNIYAAESLFAAGIHPARRSGGLSADECARLAKAVKKILRRAIAAGGSSMRDFAAADGAPGYFQTEWAVYGRAGEPCPNRCGGVIAQMRQSGRSTCYCENCQPPPEVSDG